MRNPPHVIKEDTMPRHLFVCAMLIGLGAMIAILPLSMSAVADKSPNAREVWGTVHY